jgi:hypothetical protein
VNPLAEYLKGTFNWHIDGTYDTVPQKATTLTARHVAMFGGQTEFASTYAAYENLPDGEKKRIDNLRVVHSFEAAQRNVITEPTEKDLAAWRRIPVNEVSLVWRRSDGRRSMVLGTTADHIVGMDPDESRSLLDRDDRGLHVPGGDQRQLEAVHRRVRRVLPRADPAHEAGGVGRSGEAGPDGLRGAALHGGEPARHGLLLGWHVTAQGPADGQADRARAQVRACGPWERPDIEGLDELPPGINPARHPKWGVDSFHFFPNFMLLLWAPGWDLTYKYWPTGVDSHLFETSLYFVPAKTAGQRLAHELAAVTFKEYALQDANTLEATQRMLKSRVVTEFPLCDQEILLRALHKASRDYVKEYTDGAAS